MSESFRRIRAADLISAGLLRVEDGNHGEYRPRRDEFSNVGTAFIRAADLTASGINFAGAEKINEAARSRIRKGVGAPCDTILSHKGTVGKVAFASADSPNFVCSPQTTVWRSLDHAEIDPRFLFYELQASGFQGQLTALKSESDMAPYVSLTEQRKLWLSLPPVPVQRAIAEMLGALDDKIAVNEQISRTASALASVYGQQFLSRADGDYVTLGEVADIAKGVSYRSADLESGNDRLVTLKCVGRDGRFQVEGLKRYSGDYKQSQVVKNGDIVVAQTDLTQRAEVIGRPVRVSVSGHAGRLVASLDLVAVRPGPYLSRETLLALLSTQAFREHSLSYCNGTTVLHMGARALPEFRFRLPSNKIVEAATDVMAPLLSRSDGARWEGKALADLRDTLLPGLMSGAIRVPSAEKAVEDAI
ncbi:restriction endonuclease subunit S [Micromonospora coxensis]|uniref:Type I restriction enzyme, S subunit n=1 Tax=Micromonospora coxensis TaxID=356852 RepID=A0A1C5K1C0_9ACTN|nr:restriction endonuclease subunit S [Micromonospora coxensis]SCG76600.1 type I restriction enzyme, S subunit [Micromonospora coxensis]